MQGVKCTLLASKKHWREHMFMEMFTKNRIYLQDIKILADAVSNIPSCACFPQVWQVRRLWNRR